MIDQLTWVVFWVDCAAIHGDMRERCGLCETLQEDLRRPGVRKKRHGNGDVGGCWLITSQEGWPVDWVSGFGIAGGVIGVRCQCGAAVCQAESVEVKLKVAMILI